MTDDNAAETLPTTLPPDEALWPDAPAATPAPLPEAALAQLVASILASSHPELARSLRLVAVPLWFDAGLLAALRGENDGREERILARLSQFSFIQQANEGRCTCNRSVRELLLAEWQSDRDGFEQAHRRALTEIDARLAAVAHEAHPAAYEDLTQARLYHLLVAEPAEGMTVLHRLFDAARAERRLAAAERYLDLAEELRPWLPTDRQPYLDYYQALLQQAQNRWTSSREQLTALAAHIALTPDLAARVHRGLGRALVAEEDWVGAVAEHKAALTAFEKLADQAEVARTMTDLGYAYMDLALRSWGGGESPRILPRPALWQLGERLALPIRLPIVIYLMAQWGVAALLPALGRVGRGVDWVIARLLGEAGAWLRRAEKRLQALDDAAGLIAVREHQARVYLALNHPQAAARAYRELLAAEGTMLGEFRAARARLGLAEALLRLGKEPANTAETLLVAALPVFEATQQAGYTAQAQALLAEAHVRQHKPEKAIPHYRAAIASWEQAGHRDAQTDTLDQIELLAVQPDLADAVRAELTAIAEGVPVRRYPVRYQHPLMRAFQLVALVVLAVLLFLTPFIAIRTERGAIIGAGAPVMKPLQPDVEDEFGPALALSIEQQIRPEFRVRIAGNLIGWTILGYVVAYFALGLYLIRIAPLAAIQRGQETDLELDADGIGRAAMANGPAQALRWAEITRLVIADRCLISRPIRALSDTGLLASSGRLVISGHTRHYSDIQRIAHRLSAEARRQTVGATILWSKMGALLMLALAFLVAFAALARSAPEQAISPLPGIPYSLADLYGLVLLGLAVPLGWWFAIQPLRVQLLLRPATQLAWGIGASGIMLAMLAFLQHNVWRLPLPRPDVAFPLLAALLSGLAAAHIARACWLPGEASDAATQVSRPVYVRSLRYATGVLAAVVIAIMILIAGHEILSFDALVRANAYQRQAEAPGTSKTDKVALHEQALMYFDHSLSLTATAAAHNNRGVTLAQLGRFDEAITAYQAALTNAQQQPIYLSNIGLAQHARANATPLRATYTDQVAGHRILERSRVPYYLAALSTYDRLIAALQPDIQTNRAMLVTAYLMRGGTQYELGDLRLDQARNADAMLSYEAAAKNYQWVIEHAVNDADLGAGYTGRGWSRLLLRRQHAKGEIQRLRYLERSLEDFTVAIRLTPTNASAHSGLGWSHYFIAAENHLQCARGRTAEETRPFRDHIVTSIQAFDTLAALQPTGAVHYRTRAQLNYLLRYCEDYDFVGQLQAAIADYDRALALAPARADWWYTQSGLYLEAQKPELALTSAQRSVEIDPKSLDRWLRLATAARRVGDPQEAVRAYEAAARLAPQRFDVWWLLGWSAYEAGDYARSAEASAQAATLDPFEPRVVFNQALAYVAGGQVELASSAYALGITVADLLAPVIRSGRYTEAIIDLTDIFADPRNAAPGLVERLKQARAQSPAVTRCRVIYAGADGLNLRSGPGTAYDPPLEALPKNTLSIPLARNGDSTWVRVQMVETGRVGWLNADAKYLTCNLDISTLPVVAAE